MPVHASGLQASDWNSPQQYSLAKPFVLGLASFAKVRDRLVYRGPLPLRCSFSHEHSPLIGLSEDDTFRTSATVGFGPDFWNFCVYDATLERRFVSLGAGDQADLTPLGDSPLLSPSLASCPSSLRSVYEAWKADTLSRSMLADVTSSDYIPAYFMGSSGLSSTRSCLVLCCGLLCLYLLPGVLLSVRCGRAHFHLHV